MDMNTILGWMQGRLSPSARIWTALAPGLLVAAYFLVGLALYSIRVWIRGPYRDEEVAGRGSSAFLNMWLRQYFAWLMRPIWAVILWTGIPASALTTLSLLLAVGAGVAAAAGRFSLAGWLYVFAGCLDFFDGRVARLRNTASQHGAALDSILDRYADSAILVGLGWFYRDHWALLPVFLALVGSHLVPYVRAKGESLGIRVKVGVMQRPERIVYLGVLTALSPIVEAIMRPGVARPPHVLAIIGIVLLAASTQLTALQRLFFLLRALTPEAVSLLDRHRGAIFRNGVSAVVATVLDFIVVNLLVARGVMSPPAATAVGCAAGAVLNFTLNRHWTFRSNGSRVVEASRYGFVSGAAALLNAGGVAVLLMLPGLDYRIAWALVRIAVFAAWNYPLQRNYVFVADAQHG